MSEARFSSVSRRSLMTYDYYVNEERTTGFGGLRARTLSDWCNERNPTLPQRLFVRVGAANLPRPRHVSREEA